MFRIRRVFDDVLPANRKALDEVVAILRTQFLAISKAKMDRIPDLLRDPVKHRFRSVVYVAEGSAGKVRGVAMLNHESHYVRDRGYVEAPVRVRTIRAAIEKTGLFDAVPPQDADERWLTAVHDRGFMAYLKRVCGSLDDGKSVYPYVFPIRNRARPPIELAVRAGYYCIDTFTPLSRNAYLAAHRAVDCAVTAAQEIVGGRRCAYALVRPPGHHAEREFFGGFCYFCWCCRKAVTTTVRSGPTPEVFSRDWRQGFHV